MVADIIMTDTIHSQIKGWTLADIRVTYTLYHALHMVYFGSLSQVVNYHTTHTVTLL